MCKIKSQTSSVVFAAILVGLSLFVHPTSTKAMGTGLCWGAAAAETMIPGLGFGLTGQFGKMLVLGGGKWASMNKYGQALNQSDYQEKADEIYVSQDYTVSPSGKYETDVYMNKSTYEANYYGSLYSNLWLVSLGDLYRNRCESSSETLELAFSPFRLDHFYDNWMFWAPIALLAANNATYGDNNITRYHLGTGLTEKRLKADAWQQYYMVGYGEEMFFRGTVMQSFYNTMVETWHWGPRAARHLSIYSSAAVFAVAHNGSGFTASPLVAFGSGVYLGYAYMPKTGTQDLMTAIAIHSWWDILVSYTILNNSTFTESDSKVEIPLLSLAGQF